MKFNDAWRNYIRKPNKSEKQILMEAGYRVINLLAEARKDDAKKRFPIADAMGTIDILAMELRGVFGPRGVSKYIMFASKSLEEFYEKNTWKDTTGKYHLNDNDESGEPINVLVFVRQIFDLMRDFHTKQQRLEEKDINKYDLETLKQALNKLPMSRGEKKRHLKDKTLAEKDSEVVYNNHGILAIRPLTTQASCYYGENPRLTTWCISTKSKRNYFKQYTKQEGKSFVMTKFHGIPEGDSKHFITLEFDTSGEFIQFHDAPNKNHDEADLFIVILDHLKGLYKDKVAQLGRREFAKANGDLIREIHTDLLASSREAVLSNPTVDRIAYAEERCMEIERDFEERSSYVTLDWTVSPEIEENDESEVHFAAEAEIVWDLDKPEYESENGENFAEEKLKDSFFLAEIKKKYFTNLFRYGVSFDADSDLFLRSNEDGIYLVLQLRKSGYDTYRPMSVEGFQEFAVHDATYLEEQAELMQDLLGKTINWEFLPLKPGEEIEEVFENKFYETLEAQLLGEEKGRSRQKGIYKFYCMIAYGLTNEPEKSRGLDDILADMRALPNVTIVTVAVRNQKVAEGRYIAGLSIKFIPSIPGEFNTPENIKARIVRDIKRLENVHSLFKLSTGLIRLE